MFKKSLFRQFIKLERKAKNELYHGSNCDFTEVDLSKSKDKRENAL